MSFEGTVFEGVVNLNEITESLLEGLLAELHSVR